MTKKTAVKTLENVVSVHPERMSGVPVFAGTRVPIQNLFDYLEGGETLEEFLEGFPPVTREQAVAVLELAKERLLEGVN
jgi:uncharacterized protein (DUF433 family)